MLFNWTEKLFVFSLSEKMNIVATSEPRDILILKSYMEKQFIQDLTTKILEDRNKKEFMEVWIMKKKSIVLSLALVILFVAVAGCGNTTNKKVNQVIQN